MKKLINPVDSVVTGALTGAAAAHPLATSPQTRGFSVTWCALAPQPARPRYAPVDTAAQRWGR
jgi:dihydroxyacetone kinase